jgi:hypothetical protein
VNTEKLKDDFVAGGKKSRLTLDIPTELHAQIKAKCALRGVKMVDAITEILMEEFLD